MHVFGLLLTPQIAVSYGFMFTGSLADKCFCPKWERERGKKCRGMHFLKACKGDL